MFLFKRELFNFILTFVLFGSAPSYKDRNHRELHEALPDDSPSAVGV